MDLDIRRSIINNLKDEDETGIIDSINSATNSKDEIVLPGLGVLLELVWSELTSDEQHHFASLVIKKMNK